MLTALFPGSFDPPTLGHLNIIERSSPLFEHIYVAVSTNQTKGTSLLSAEDRLKLIKQMTDHLPNVSVVYSKGLTVEIAKIVKADVIVKGLRNGSDYDMEEIQASMNHKMCGIETLFLPAEDPYRLISSTWVRDILRSGQRAEQFLPESILDSIHAMLANDAK